MKPLRSTAPATSLLSPSFRYTPAAATDLHATFERIRRERAQWASAAAQRGTALHLRLEQQAAVLPGELADVARIGKGVA